jgi:hypothetical protein
MSKTIRWVQKKAKNIKNVLTDNDPASVEISEYSIDQTSKSNISLSCIIPFKELDSVSIDWQDYLSSTAGTRVLRLPSYWLDETMYDKIPDEVTTSILLHNIGGDPATLQLFDSPLKMAALLKTLNPAVIIELIDRHACIAQEVILAARFLCEESIADVTIFNSIHMLNLYQHPAIFPFVAGKKSVGSKGEEQQVVVDKYIQNKFFQLTTVFKESDLLIPELWCKIAGYLQLKDINMELAGWNYEMTEFWYGDGYDLSSLPITYT